MRRQRRPLETTRRSTTLLALRSFFDAGPASIILFVLLAIGFEPADDRAAIDLAQRGLRVVLDGGGLHRLSHCGLDPCFELRPFPLRQRGRTAVFLVQGAV